MTQAEQQTTAKQFSEFWQGKGDEKQETQRFWIGLLGDVLGIESPANYIEFEKKVQLKHASFIDGYIPETKVLIEQKGAKIDLHKSYEQSDGTELTPYQQAKRYADEMPLSQKPAWIVVCNFKEFLVYNMEKPHEEPTQILLKDLPKEAYLLNFIVQHKTDALQREIELSIEAGKIVGELYDELLKQYKKKDDFELKSLNMLCVRLVFCLYAEDSGIFGKRLMFHDFLASFNAENVRTALIELFKILDQKNDERDPYLDEKFAQFPYVNGGLFRDEKILIPPFNDRIRDFLLNKASSFDWSEISPTIFGAVFESTLNPDTRRSGGMHYTSIENIHKVIDPLFMDELNAEFEEITGISVAQQKNAVVEHVETTRTGKTSVVSMNSTTGIGHFDKLNVRLSKKQAEKLLAFQKKLGSLTFLDPACGSGNFLTETYLSLRRLENKVIMLLNEGEKVLGFDEFIQVKINQFYGIEINDFAVTVAKTALWIAESQMISETEQIVSQTIDFLPLTTNAFIVEGNALRMDWSTLTPIERCFADAQHDGHSERSEESLLTAADTLFANFTTHVDGTAHHYNYIMGNPPFVGQRYISREQHDDIISVLTGWDNAGKLDYVCGWYKKSFDLIKRTDTKVALVSTNSITQGEQVANLWKPLFDDGLQINFAYRTFRWDSESDSKAHVHCVIIGFSDKSTKVSEKFIYNEAGIPQNAKNINGYLIDAENVFVNRIKNPLCKIPPMVTGNRQADGGFLTLSEDEMNELVKKEPDSKKYIRQMLGSEEFINNKKLYCLWLLGITPNELRKMPLVHDRVKKCQEHRLSGNPDRQRLASTPTLFREQINPDTAIIIPTVSSEKRKYVPMGFIDKSIIVNANAQVVADATIFHFGILTSSVHMAWMRAVAGRLEMRYRYSKDIVYNNFPWCSPTDAQKAKIEFTAQGILDARAKYPDASLADLYDDTAMPPDLRKAHQANDRAVMAAYGFGAKMTEAEIVAELFKMYEKLCAKVAK